MHPYTCFNKQIARLLIKIALQKITCTIALLKAAKIMNESTVSGYDRHTLIQ